MTTMNTWLSTLLLVSLTSCSSLTLSVDEVAPAIAASTPFITSFICPQDSVLAVRVEKTLSTGTVMSGRQYAGEAIKNASVTISDGVNSVVLRQNITQFGRYETLPNQFSVVGGRTYQLVVVTPDGQTLTASCTVPKYSIDRQQVSFTKATITGSQASVVRLQWRDSPGVGDYYATYSYAYSKFSKEPTPRIYGEGPSEFFDDKLRDAQLFQTRPTELQATVNSPTLVSQNAFVLCRTDKLYYDYHATIESINRSKDNPFADPIRLPSNVQGGNGVFCGYNRLVLNGPTL